MEVRSRCSRERVSSPDRAKVCMQVQGQAPPPRKPIKKVKVVYYISRNGQLEHPHYMEVTHLATQHLRLRDFMDRLTLLRGKGMPSMFSWSCKRSYKNGYVWNDLAENDVIYPSEGAEYVLKGSELVEGCSEKLQHHLQVSNVGIANRQPIHHQDPILHAKRPQQLGPSQPTQVVEETRPPPKFEYQDYEEEPEEDESQEEFEDEYMKTSSTSSTTPHSRCSRGVSTDELEPTIVSTRHDSVPTQSLINTPNPTTPTGVSKRFEDGDPLGTESAPSRNSLLLQLISCGNSAMAKAKNNSTGLLKQRDVMTKANVDNNNSVVRRSESDLHRGVLFKSAVKVAEDELMIRCMSEDPRFGNSQAEEKEYFSGSIVESMSEDRVATQPGLKRSNSYNEERKSKAMVEEVKEEKIKEKAVRGKCIPLKKSSKPNKK